MTIDIADIKAKAAAAHEQAPAKWIAGAEREDGTAEVYMPNDGPCRRVVPVAESSGPCAVFIAAASPYVALALLARLERAEEALRAIADADSGADAVDIACEALRAALGDRGE